MNVVMNDIDLRTEFFCRLLLDLKTFGFTILLLGRSIRLGVEGLSVYAVTYNVIEQCLLM